MITIRNPRRGTFRNDPTRWKVSAVIEMPRRRGHVGRVLEGGMRTHRRRYFPRFVEEIDCTRDPVVRCNIMMMVPVQ